MENPNYKKMVDYVEESAKKLLIILLLILWAKKTSYAQLAAKIHCAAKSLIELGVKSGDTVCVAMPNMPQAIVLIYAANKIGAAVNMIHPLSSPSEIKGFIKRVNADTILIPDEFYEKIKKIKADTCLKNVIVASAAEELPTIRNGYNVFPNVLENVIESFNMVDRCCVMGIPDTEGTCKIKAFIVLKDGFEPGDEVKAEISGLCREEIARYAVPKEIEFIDEMPKTLVGKVDYKALGGV